MPFADLAWLLAAAAVTAVLTGLIRRRAIARGLLDLPNARSSHAAPTPRGGGLAIVVVVLAAVAIAAGIGRLAAPIAFALLICGSLVAGVGYLDDARGLRAAPRLIAHFGASVAIVATLSLTGIFAELPPIVAALLLVVGLVWSLNLFNFMDGIDGIAAAQAAFVSLASAGLAAAQLDPIPRLIVLPLATAGACIGFLGWNWPPARIFMGDVGSGFLGFWLAALALVFHQAGVLVIWTSVILGSAFIADTTVTLLRRLARRERLHEAHRSHAYQHLARRFGRHRPVTLLVCALNLGLALPLAAASLAAPRAAPLIATGSLAVFGLLALLAGAGRQEARGTD